MWEIAVELVERDHSDVLTLACAEMMDMKAAVEDAIGSEVKVVNRVVAGVQHLYGLVRMGVTTAKRGFGRNAADCRAARGQEYLLVGDYANPWITYDFRACHMPPATWNRTAQREFPGTCIHGYLHPPYPGRCHYACSTKDPRASLKPAMLALHALSGLHCALRRCLPCSSFALRPVKGEHIKANMNSGSIVYTYKATAALRMYRAHQASHEHFRLLIIRSGLSCTPLRNAYHH